MFSSIRIFFFIILILAIILISINIIFAKFKPYFDKTGSFECGFSNFSQTRERFEIHFYRTGLLFMIFDIEIILIYPYLVSAYHNSSFGTYVLLIFLVLLTLGFLYELGKDALSIKKIFN
jgi:NADH-ubiquinone oxidoreductase chain 3